MKMAYQAVNEEPTTWVAYGATPARALRNMARIMKKNNVEFWLASRVDFYPDEAPDFRFCIVVYS